VLLAVLAEADVELVAVEENFEIVVYDGVHISTCVGCAAGASCRGVCSWYFLPAWLRRTWSWTWWRR